MKKNLHAITGATALLTISVFWISTVLSKLLGTVDQIVFVKVSILWGMLILIPAMATAGSSGFSLGGKWKTPLVKHKMTRMKIIAANGILVLIPSAIFLATRAQAHNFDRLYSTIQIIELIAGAINITLLILNARDGVALSRRTRKNS